MKCYPITVVKRRGFTALELIIVLVVGFSIIALSASKMGQLFSSSSTAAAMSSILELYTSARSLRGIKGYEGEGTTNNLLKLLINAKMVPKGLSVTGTEVKNEWGGDVTITVTDSKLGFNLQYSNVPSDACLKLAQNLIHSGNFTVITVGKDAKNSLSIEPGSTVSEMITNCTPKGSEKTVTMFFTVEE